MFQSYVTHLIAHKNYVDRIDTVRTYSSIQQELCGRLDRLKNVHAPGAKSGFKKIDGLLFKMPLRVYPGTF